jgi:hypothetical protein
MISPRYEVVLSMIISSQHKCPIFLFERSGKTMGVHRSAVADDVNTISGDSANNAFLVFHSLV